MRAKPFSNSLDSVSDHSLTERGFICNIVVLSSTTQEISTTDTQVIWIKQVPAGALTGSSTYSTSTSPSFAAHGEPIYDVIVDRIFDLTCPSTSPESIGDLLTRFTRDSFRSTRER